MTRTDQGERGGRMVRMEGTACNGLGDLSVLECPGLRVCGEMGLTRLRDRKEGSRSYQL